MQYSEQHQQANKAMVTRLILVVIAMFAFGFALVPLYDVFCDITGINGKTDNAAASYQSVAVDTNREITIDFITRVNSGMSWQFEAQTKRIKVHPGQLNQVAFRLKNPTNRDIVGQAIPSVSPGPAALYLNKTECFCFNNQPLGPGEQAVMPMQFYVDPQLPADISFFTLQYTLYDVTSTASRPIAQTSITKG